MDELTAICRQPFHPVTWGETIWQAAAIFRFYPHFLGTLFSQAPRVFGPRLRAVLRPMQRTKLVPRYLRGAHLGWLLARYLLRDHANLSSRDYTVYGDFFGSWGVAIIATDYVLDSHLASPEAAPVFLEDFLEILQGWNDAGQTSPTAEAGEKPGHPYPSADAVCLALGLGRLVRANTEKLRRIWPEAPGWRAAWQVGKHTWLKRTKALLAGQLKSLKQFDLTEENNWKWYYEEILNQKTINFFLAPIALYCLTPTALKKYEILKEYFLSLNSRFFHWQLMDDIADITADTRDGMITSPGYVLISQAQLASHFQNYIGFLNNDIDISNKTISSIAEQNIISPALETCLLIEEFCPPLLWDEIQAYRQKADNNRITLPPKLAQRCARTALSNLPSDERLSMSELIARRVAQKTSYMQAMASGDRDAAVAQVLESGAAYRLLGVAQDAHRIAGLKAKLRHLDDPALLAVLRILHGMMARACRRAVRIIQGSYPPASTISLPGS